jgi:serine/threonine protein kinase
MNNVMLGLIGIWEIGIILLILLVMAGLAVGVVLLVVWLVRRNQTPSSTPAKPSTPRPTPPPPTSANCPRCGTTLPPDSPQGLCPRCVLGVGLDAQTEATGEFGPHGTKIVPPPEAEVARRFPHLEILGCLGHGGMGVVYKARQPKLNRFVALKILAPEKGADPKFAERFLREAQALARLSHPNIVTVHDFGEADGMFFLLMEFVDGMTLRQLLREGLMKPEQALAIVPPICEALQFAHEQGVVHRDIKPENVLLDKQGRVKIADFGIAKIINPLSRPADTLSPSDGERAGVRGQGLTQDQVIGTPHYMAPEQVEKPATVDHRADIYSLGVVFYEMLTGELPLGKFQPPSKKVQVDVRLDEVVLHALEKEPDRRYQKASQVKTDVETIAATPSPGSSGRESSPSGSASPPVAVAASSNAKEAMIVFAGTVFFLFMIAVVEEMFHRAGPFRGFLVVICVVGLARCVLSLAGIWPFPSPWFPEPNFSSRNLRRGKPTTASTTQRGGAWKVAAVIIAAVIIVLAVPTSAFLLWFKAYRALSREQVVTDSGSVVRVEAKLRREIVERLAEGGWKAEGLSVSVSPNLKRGECRFGRIWKNGLTREPPPQAAIHLEPQGNGLWQVRGEGEFGSLRFSVDTSAEMASRQGPGGAQPGIFQYAEPEGANSASSLVQRVPRFGPVRELTLNHWVDDSPGSEALDLDRGELVDLPKDFEKLPEPEQMQWLRDQGADLLLLLDRAQGQWGLITVARNELKLAWLPFEKWDTAKHEDLSDALEAESVGLEIRQRGEFRVYLLAANQHPPLTLAFHTARGARGLLQITSFTEQPDSARLRFKLLQSSGGGVAGATPKIVAPEFGPVIERVVKDDGAGSNFFIDLDTGKLLSPPADLKLPGADPRNQEAFLAWVRESGIDAMGETSLSVKGLVGMELIARPVPGPLWEKLTPQALPADAAFSSQRTAATATHLSAKGELPETFLFKTREGGVGLLQITGFTENPHGVKIRYKLVQATPANGRTFGPVIERELPDPDNGSGRGNRETLRLRTGKRMSVLDDAPKASGGRLRALVASEGDLFAEYDDFVSGRWAFVTAGLKLSDFLTRQWETATPGELDEALRQPSALQRVEHSGATLYYLPDGLLPLTFAFESRTGERGLLQITGFADNPRGMKIRYRLVQAVPANRLAFGPVVERTLQGRNETRTNCFMDFESGQVLDAPATLAMTNRAAVWEWAKAQGVDAVAMTTEDIRGLLGYELIVGPLRDDDWETVSSEDVSKALTKAAFDAQRFPGQDPLAQFVVTVNTISTSTNQPRTYAFRTREGNPGLLQFRSYTDAPGGSVTIRYKLVRSTAP